MGAVLAVALAATVAAGAGAAPAVAPGAGAGAGAGAAPAVAAGAGAGAAPAPDLGAVVQRRLAPGEIATRTASGDLNLDGVVEIGALVREPAGTWRVALHGPDGAELWRRPLAPIEAGDLRADRGSVAFVSLGAGKRDLLDVSIPLEGSARAWRVVYAAGATGAAPPRAIYEDVTGADPGEYGRALEIYDVNPEEGDGEKEIVAYAIGETATLCDGSPARIDPRIFDWKSGKLRPVALTPSPLDDVPRLTAVVAPAGAGAPAGSASTLSFFAASSSPGFGGSPAAIAPPKALGDGKAETAWFEGDELDGRGEFVMAHVETGRPIRALRIVPGDASSKKAWKEHNRLERALLRVGSGVAGRRWLVTFPKLDAPGAVRIELPEPLATACIALVIVSVYPGSSPKVTAVGEVTALTDLDDLAGAERVKLLAADVAAGPSSRALAAARALIDLAGGPDAEARAPALDALAAALAAGRPPAAPAVVAAIGLAEHPSRALGDLTVAALATPVAELRAALVEKIVHHGEAMAPSVLAPLAADAPPSPAPRAALIEVLGRMTAKGSAGAVDALVELLGRCDAGDLAPVEKALAAAGAAGYPPLLAFADARGGALACPESLAKLLGGLGRPPAGTPADRLERVVALLAGWLAPERSFALRFHAARALGRFAGAEAVKTLALAALKDPEERVRERAVRSLAEHEGEERPAAVIARALADPDPNVRLAALSEAPDTTGAFAEPRKEAVAAAIAILEGDPWPELRRGALLALVRFGGDDAAAALLRACGDAQVEVAAAAMDAVAHSAPPGAAATLESILVNEKLGARRRVAAAVALGDLGGHAGASAPAIVKILQRYRMLARGDEKAEELAQACARALGMIGAASPATAKEAKLVEELTDALVGGPTNPVRTACAWALGALGDAGACEILLDAKDNAPDPETRNEAARAAAKLGCGKK